MGRHRAPKDPAHPSADGRGGAPCGGSDLSGSAHRGAGTRERDGGTAGSTQGPVPAVPPQLNAELAELIADYGKRWTIEHEPEADRYSARAPHWGSVYGQTVPELRRQIKKHDKEITRGGRS